MLSPVEAFLGFFSRIRCHGLLKDFFFLSHGLNVLNCLNDLNADLPYGSP